MRSAGRALPPVGRPGRRPARQRVEGVRAGSPGSSLEAGRALPSSHCWSVLAAPRDRPCARDGRARRGDAPRQAPLAIRSTPASASPDQTIRQRAGEGAHRIEAHRCRHPDRMSRCDGRARADRSRPHRARPPLVARPEPAMRSRFGDVSRSRNRRRRSMSGKRGGDAAASSTASDGEGREGDYVDRHVTGSWRSDRVPRFRKPGGGHEERTQPVSGPASRMAVLRAPRLADAPHRRRRPGRVTAIGRPHAIPPTRNGHGGDSEHAVDPVPRGERRQWSGPRSARAPRSPSYENATEGPRQPPQPEGR